LQLSPNKRRVINTRVVEYREGKKRSKTIFGFMALNGNDVAMVSDKARADDMKAFLGLVEKENHGMPILAVMDNARIHKAKIVRERADELDVHQVYLPPYSPDLNPIEFGWKDLKRELGVYLAFDKMVSMGRDVVLKLFKERKLSYAEHWIESFISIKS
jgi:putative transposase